MSELNKCLQPGPLGKGPSSVQPKPNEYQTARARFIANAHPHLDMKPSSFSVLGAALAAGRLDGAANKQRDVRRKTGFVLPQRPRPASGSKSANCCKLLAGISPPEQKTLEVRKSAAFICVSVCQESFGGWFRRGMVAQQWTL